MRAKKDPDEVSQPCRGLSLVGTASAGFGRKPIMRYRPATMEEVRKCLDFCSADMKVDVKSDVPLVAKTVGDLCSLPHGTPA